MKNRWSLKGQNRGASLIAVVTAIVFVSVIGIVITQITITNIQMKEMEQQSKKNFYDAEKVMDDLTTGLNTLAAEAMQKAYTEMLSKYRTVTASGGNVQQTFARLYLDYLIEEFEAGPEPTGAVNSPMKRYDGLTADALVSYQVGYYGLDVVKGCFSDDYQDKADDLLKTVATVGDNSVSYYRADYTTGTFVLDGIMISSTNDLGYTTTIRTDMVFHTPELNFEGSNMVKEFMRYSLIADNDINVNSGNILVNGNAYAGADGIHADATGCSATFSGNTIITRGDIIAGAGADLKVGSDLSKVWAENVRTIGNGTGAKLTLNGNCYISDDLEVNGRESIVTLKGNYYGYNFQKDYAGATPVVKSEYSSAIVINGRKARLDMTNLRNLTLSGRTYITRDSSHNDVALGESLSVRSNQLAYYVPDRMLDTVDPTHVVFVDTTGAEVSAYLGVANIYNYVSAGAPVSAYNYRDASGSTSTAYYLNFGGDEQKANSFFTEAYGSNKDLLNEYAQSYVADNALILSSDIILTLKGDLLYRNGAGNLDDLAVTISNSNWSESGIFYDRAGYLGATYKSLQMYLEESHIGINASDIRFGDSNDKTVDKLLNNILDVSSMQAYLADKPGKIMVKEYGTDDAGKKQVIVLVDNKGGSAYTVDASYGGGLIVATGDVAVFTGTAVSGQQFSGLVMSGGTITFAANAAVEANEVLVSKMFADDLASTKSDFAFLFRGYNTISDSVIGEVAIDKYLTYDNWTKTVE